jgi:hypothetical protein
MTPILEQNNNEKRERKGERDVERKQKGESGDRW